MRKLGVVEFLTLDGVMQSLGSPDEDRDGGFPYGGWSAPYGDEVAGLAAAKGFGETTGYLFGRSTAANPWLAGLTLLTGGLILVAVAMILEG